MTIRTAPPRSKRRALGATSSVGARRSCAVASACARADASPGSSGLDGARADSSSVSLGAAANFPPKAADGRDETEQLRCRLECHRRATIEDLYPPYSIYE